MSSGNWGRAINNAATICVPSEPALSLCHLGIEGWRWNPAHVAILIQHRSAGLRAPSSGGKTRDGSVYEWQHLCLKCTKQTSLSLLFISPLTDSRQLSQLNSPNIGPNWVKRTELVQTFQKIYKFTRIFWCKSALSEKEEEHLIWKTISHKTADVLTKISSKSHLIVIMETGINSIIFPQINLLNGLACGSSKKKKIFVNIVLSDIWLCLKMLMKLKI